MRQIKYIILIIFSIFITTTVEASNHIYNVDININLDKQGTAEVTEIWDVKGSEGTEWYQCMYDLGNMNISDYTVSMDGKPLKYKDWNVNESLKEKAGYYGINYTSKGEELCFGKKDYKRHKFTLKFKLSNMIFNTEDSQVLYYNAIGNFKNTDFENVNINITGFYNFPDTLDVWGYGYKGYAYVKDGKISASNEGDFDDNYAVILAKFPKETFETTNSYQEYQTFDDVLAKAKEGSFEYDYDEDESEESFIEIIADLFYALVFIVPIIIGVVASKKNRYGYKDNKTIDKNNTNMFRDIPCNKDIYYANALINLNKFGYKESSIFGAIILKWVKQDKITFRHDEKTGIFNKETSSIDLTKSVTFDNEIEQELFEMMRAASGDGILETKELERWCRNNYSRFLKLFDRLKDDKINELKLQNHIYQRTSKEECKYKNVMDDSIYKDSTELYGLKLFLEEFSRIDTREVLEVKIWDEYLMFAYLFGMADKVAKQLKNLYPDTIAQSNFDYDTIIFVNTITTSGASAASSARAAAESYSSGGGGFSSGGGGGGSFGGGGGGSR